MYNELKKVFGNGETRKQTDMNTGLSHATKYLRTKRCSCLLLFVFAGILVMFQRGWTAELVGLQNLPLQSDDLLWGFNIHLTEGRIIAVCNIPEGWKITAENYGEAALNKDGGGEVQGGADFGHDALSVRNVSQLKALLLIDRSTVHRKRATLSGELTVFRFDNDNTKVPLGPHNFTRREAQQCPPSEQNR